MKVSFHLISFCYNKSTLHFLKTIYVNLDMLTHQKKICSMALFMFHASCLCTWNVQCIHYDSKEKLNNSYVLIMYIICTYMQSYLLFQLLVLNNIVSPPRSSSLRSNAPKQNCVCLQANRRRRHLTLSKRLFHGLLIIIFQCPKG